MDDHPPSDTVGFDGHAYTADDLPRVLRDAAHGLVPYDDTAIAFDPVGWTVAFVRALRGSSLWPALSAILAELMLGDDEEEARLAAAVGRITGVMGAEITTQALAKQSQYGRTETVTDLAWAMASLAMFDQHYRYDPLLRTVLMRVPSSLALIMVVARFDGAWFVEHAATLCAQNVSEAARQLAYAEMGAGDAPQFRADLRAALAARRPELVPLLDRT